MILKTTNSRI